MKLIKRFGTSGFYKGRIFVVRKNNIFDNDFEYLNFRGNIIINGMIFRDITILKKHIIDKFGKIL